MSDDQDSDDVFEQLLALPLDDRWVVAAHQLPAAPKGASGPPWLLLIQSRTRHFVLGSSTRARPLTPQELLNALVNTMFEPAQSEPHRPEVIEMGPNLPWEPVAAMLEQLEVSLEPAGSLSDLNTAFQYLSMQIVGRPIPGLSIEQG